MKNKKISHLLIVGGLLLGVISIGTIAHAESLTSNGSTVPQSRYALQNLADAQKQILTQAKDLFKQGKKTEAQKLLTDNNITLPLQENHGHKGAFGNKIHSPEGNPVKVTAAILAGDYTAFKQATLNGPLSKISQAVFVSLQAPMLARKQADDQIKSILQNAGISPLMNHDEYDNQKKSSLDSIFEQEGVEKQDPRATKLSDNSKK